MADRIITLTEWVRSSMSTKNHPVLEAVTTEPETASLTVEDLHVFESWARTKAEQYGLTAKYPNLHYANECLERAKRLSRALDALGDGGDTE